MNKQAETLKRPVFRDDVLPKHIVDTYFHQKARPKTRKRKENALLSLVKFLKRISLVLLISVVSAVILLSAITIIHNKYISYLEKKAASLKAINIILDGHVNKEFIKSFEFRGYARNAGSGISKEAVTINNAKKYNWADLAIDFKFPIDLSARNLKLSMRGRTGGEAIGLVLRDADNKAIRLKNIYLTSNWKDEFITIDDARKYIDISRIKHIRIECGLPGESGVELGSPINITAYVKNLSMMKEV